MDINVVMNATRTGDLATLKQAGSQSPQLLGARDARGFTPLIMATYTGNEAVMNTLIELGVDVNDRDGSGNTALMGIAFKGNLALAGKLIELGAELDLQNGNGSTALMFAVTYGQNEMAQLLIDSGADKGLRDFHGKDALTHAREQQNATLISLLEGSD